MARPAKMGLDYFPFDVELINDRKFRHVKDKYGAIAVLVYIEILCLIYRDKGYYLLYNDKTIDDVTWEIRNAMQGRYQPDTSTIREIIADLAACGLFDGDRFKNGLITSKRIQSVYLQATVRRNAVELDADILIPGEEEAAHTAGKVRPNGVIADKNRVNVDKNGVNVNKNTTKESKGKEKKEKESKVKQILLVGGGQAADVVPVVVSNKQFSEDMAEIAKVYRECIGRLYKHRKEEIEQLLNEVTADVIIWAIREGEAKGKSNWSYIRGIINNHCSEGRKTLDEILEYCDKYKRKFTAKDTSIYKCGKEDYSEIEKRMMKD